MTSGEAGADAVDHARNSHTAIAVGHYPASLVSLIITAATTKNINNESDKKQHIFVFKKNVYMDLQILKK